MERYNQIMTTLRLLSRRAETPVVHTFVFQSVEPLKWTAGQSIKLEVPTLYGPTDHRFTISSPPHTNEIHITTRNSGSLYKQGLWQLAPGDTVHGYGIEGAFVLPQDNHPLLWVAAGLGITPFWAMLSQALHEGKTPDITLLYAGKKNDMPFANALAHIAVSNQNLRLLLQPDTRLRADYILEQYKPGMRIYLAGPSLMVDALSSELGDGGVDETHLKRDWFTGLQGDSAY